jgi:hypothetical protein
MMPLIVLGLIAFVGLVLSILTLIISRFTGRIKFDLNLQIRTAVAILLYNYTNLTTTAFQSLACIDVNGDSLLYTHPSISCNSPEYKSSIISQYFVIILVTFGLPVQLMRLGLKYYRKTVLSVQFRVRWDALFQPYKKDRFFYQSIVLIRRAVYAALIAGMGYLSNPLLIKMAITIVALTCLVTHVFLQPFRLSILNVIETYLLFMHITLSVVMFPFSKPFPIEVTVITALFVITPVILFIVNILYRRIYGYTNEPETGEPAVIDHDKNLPELFSASRKNSVAADGFNGPALQLASLSLGSENATTSSRDVSDEEIVEDKDVEYVMNPHLLQAGGNGSISHVAPQHDSNSSLTSISDSLSLKVPSSVTESSDQEEGETRIFA